ncbi:MAG: CDP-alcohol phosphatidyltransferase family protein [bacterium]|nr:CDP-alcohol phosphatidyltransferase family protein [bacterium]MDZ4231218.1 CDP-alcohol phosphatidyltransferase family protein [Patescibacteria group bacterium]
MSKERIPNLLSALRIVLVIPVVVLILHGGYATVAFIVFCVASMTDFADGLLARGWKVTSQLGAMLDTIADKVLSWGALLALLQVGLVWFWVVALIIVRDCAVLYLRRVHGKRMISSWAAKWKMTFQYFAIATAIIRGGTTVAGLFPDQWLMLLTCAMSIQSAVGYFARYGLKEG